MLIITDAKKTEGEKAEEIDQEILEAIKSRRKLVSDMELARGIQYTEPLKTRYDAHPRLFFPPLTWSFQLEASAICM